MYRRELGLSQEAYAHECGIDRTYVSGVERRIKNPTVKMLEKLAKGVDRSPHELLEPFE